MKNILKLFVTLLVACPLAVNAAEKHTTLNQCTIEDEQYISMKKTLTDEQIDELNCDLIENLKGKENIHLSTQYFDIITYDKFLEKETLINELTKDEYYSTTSSDNTTTTNPYQTEYKRLLVTTATSSPNEVYINATLTWLKMPAHRGFDIWALRVNNGGAGVFSWKTTETADGSTTTLQNGIPSAIVLKDSGYGATIGISSKAKTSLIENLTTSAYTTSKPSQLTLTYQHSQKDVPFNDTNNWSISPSGYGGVISFNTSAARDAYDQMRGIVVNLVW